MGRMNFFMTIEVYLMLSIVPKAGVFTSPPSFCSIIAALLAGFSNRRSLSGCICVWSDSYLTRPDRFDDWDEFMFPVPLVFDLFIFCLMVFIVHMFTF